MAITPPSPSPPSSFAPNSAPFGATMANVVMLIDVFQETQYINSIVASYSKADPAAHEFALGRLLILRGRPNLSTIPINPYNNVTPDAVQAAKLFDVTLPEAFTYLEFGGDGFELQPNSQYSIVLTAPATVTDVWPVSAFYNGFLNAIGKTINKPDPFKTLR
jgi:hypothetical protein